MRFGSHLRQPRREVYWLVTIGYNAGPSRRSRNRRRSYPLLRPMVRLQGRREQTPRIGRLVQQPPPAFAPLNAAPAKADANFYAAWETEADGRVTHGNQLPANPARF